MGNDIFIYGTNIHALAGVLSTPISIRILKH